MIDINTKDIFFRMKIVDYQFGLSNAYWDSNWLLVSVELTDNNNGIRFSNVDPCLLTMELRDLRDWFRSIQLDSICGNKHSFMEPCLSFQRSENGVNLFLRFELNPNNNDFFDVYKVDLDNDDIKRLVLNLDNLLLEFPVRGKED